jgi:divalent metal cation (Fe/Co/Zn/Cd) transporter
MADTEATSIDPRCQTVLERQGRWWEYGTTGWNSLEAFVAIGSGAAAHSLGLVAFGLDSCIEVFASVVVLWHLAEATDEVSPGRTRRAMRLIGAAFAVLGVLLLAGAVQGVLTRHLSKPSPIGVAFMAATIVVMFVLAWGKRRTGLALGNRPLVANASMTLLDGCLAGGVLVALVIDQVMGWWWADSAAAGLVALVMLNEAREAFTSEEDG